MAEAVVVLSYALTAYSAVTAVKALSDGDIMGAMMSGFGAYMGMSNLGAFNTATVGDATASTAAQTSMGSTQAEMLAEQTGNWGAEATADALGVLDGGALGEAGASVMAGYETATMNLPSAGLDVSASMTPNISGTSSALGGLGDSISSTWDSIVQGGKGFINSMGDLVSTQDGSLLAKAGEAVSEIGMNNIMKGVGMGLEYMGKKDAIDAQEKAADKTYSRAQQEALRARTSVGAAPGYVHEFKGRRTDA